MTDYKFYGWVGKNKESIGNLVWEEYEPKTWTEDDVDIKISMTPPLLIVCRNFADLG
jgi:alcohol dehydrogenase (NADP+)